MRIALVSRDEVYPLGGGGIGQFVTAAARLLSRIAEVTIVTASAQREPYQRLRAARDERLPGDNVRMVFVDAPRAEEAAGWYQPMQDYSARLLDALRGHYGERGPEVIEFADFLGEGFVTTQAAWALDPFLRDTRVCVRLHTSAEMTEVLDGFWKPEPAAHAVHALERGALARADRVIWQGGDVLGTYERFYGPGALAATQRIRYPYAGPSAGPDPAFTIGERPLRLLYAGRLERRKGVVELVRAATGLQRDDWHLTVVGADTTTGPLATSIRDQLELTAAGDGRVTLSDGVPREQLAELIVAHDVVVVPSRWECWPYAALEPLHLNRPVLATPVGGLSEMIQAGRSGWLTSGSGRLALEQGLEAVLDDRHGVESLVRSGAPLGVARELCDEQEILDGYEGLARSHRARPTTPVRAAAPPLVSILLTADDVSTGLGRALLAQTHHRLEVVLIGREPGVNGLLAPLQGRIPVIVCPTVAVTRGGLLNAGVSAGSGRYALALAPGIIPTAEFVARGVQILESAHEIAYVTSWARAVGPPDPRDQPLGNDAPLLEEEDVGGCAGALWRRALLAGGLAWPEDLGDGEDWQLHRRLNAAGHRGAVIPERLLSREHAVATRDSVRQDRLAGEMLARQAESAVRWTADPR